ncbi:DUF3047 domain-containing protein [Candidatus Sumerlaeota bacterium]|nr:DUF3047 domain-containing protein [Candidatus Sumerlaeota bacterium]
MRNKIIILLYLIITICSVSRAIEDEIVVFDSNSHKLGEMPPAGWYVRNYYIGYPGQNSWYKIVEEDGERSLLCESEVSAIVIAKELKLKASEYPWIIWRFKVDEIPYGGDEREKKTEDSSLRIMLYFKNGKTLSYNWSSRLPKGFYCRNPWFPEKIFIIVAGSGWRSKGQWLTFQANYVEDYKTILGSEPDELVEVGILSDSDNTFSSTRSFISWIKLRRTEKEGIEKVSASSSLIEEKRWVERRNLVANKVKNLIVNGGFEVVKNGVPIGWHTNSKWGVGKGQWEIIPEAPQSGKYCAHILWNSQEKDSGAQYYQEVKIRREDIGKELWLFGWVRTKKTNTHLFIDARSKTGKRVAYGEVECPADGRWHLLSISLPITEETRVVCPSFRISYGSGEGWFDNMELYIVPQGIEIKAINVFPLFARRNGSLKQVLDVILDREITGDKRIEVWQKGKKVSAGFEHLGEGRYDVFINLPIEKGPALCRVINTQGEKIAEREFYLEERPRWEVFLAPGSHIDYGYGGSALECRQMVEDIILKALDVLESYSDYKFIIESTAGLESLLKRKPEEKRRIKKYLKEGRLEVSSFWTLPMNLYDGEGMERCVESAREWLEEELDYTPMTVQQHDLPGNIYQLPGILKRQGIGLYLWSRGTHPPLYWWRGLDGERVLAYICPSPWLYNAGAEMGFHKDALAVRKGVMLNRLNAVEKMMPVKKFFVPDECDWTYPYPVTVEIVKEWNKRYAYPKVKFSTAREYYEELMKEKSALMRLHQETMPGANDGWTWAAPGISQIFYKQQELESKLLAVEKLAALISINQRYAFPLGKFRRIWRELLFTYDHNLGGIHDNLNFKEKYRMLEEGLGKTKTMLKEMLRKFAPKDVKSVVVFNPLNWEREEEIALEVDDEEGTLYEITNEEQRSWLSRVRVEGNRKVLCVPVKVKALGISRLELKKIGQRSLGEQKKEVVVLENKFLTVRIDTQKGEIKSIYDRRNQRELLKEKLRIGVSKAIKDAPLINEEGLPEMAKGYREPYRNLVCLFIPEEVAIWEHNGRRSVAMMGYLDKEKERKCIFEITLSEEKAEVEFYMHVEWKRWNHHFVFLDLPLNLKNPEVRYGVAYGDVELKPFVWGASVVNRWILAKGQEDYSVGIAFDKSLFVRFKDARILPILFHDERSFCRTDPGTYWASFPEYSYEMRFVLILGGNEVAKRVRIRAEELRQPLIAQIIEKGDTATIKEPIGIRGDDIVLSSMGFQKDGKTLRMRLKNISEEEKKVEILTSQEFTERKKVVKLKAYGCEFVELPLKKGINVIVKAPLPPEFRNYTEDEIMGDGSLIESRNLLKNSGFEEGNGKYPAEWISESHWGYGKGEWEWSVGKEIAHSGERCVRVRLEDAHDSGSGAQFYQSVDVHQLQGKIIRFCGYVKTDKPGAVLYMDSWDKEGRCLCGTGKKVVGTGEWQFVYCDMQVPKGAVSVACGVRVLGPEADAMFDDVALYILRDFPF